VLSGVNPPPGKPVPLQQCRYREGLRRSTQEVRLGIREFSLIELLIEMDEMYKLLKRETDPLIINRQNILAATSFS